MTVFETGIDELYCKEQEAQSKVNVGQSQERSSGFLLEVIVQEVKRGRKERDNDQNLGKPKMLP